PLYPVCAGVSEESHGVRCGCSGERAGRVGEDLVRLAGKTGMNRYSKFKSCDRGEYFGSFTQLVLGVREDFQ
nr:hypothetical protein [Tanacetum cinerariifolium]